MTAKPSSGLSIGPAQARQLRNGPPLLIAKQVVVLVDGHFDAGMAHELAHGRDITAFPQEDRGEEVPDVIHDDRIGDAGLFNRRLQRASKFPHRLALVLDDVLTLGLFPNGLEPFPELGRYRDDAGGLRLGRVDLDAAALPVNVVPGQGQQLGLAGTDTEVPGHLNGPGEMGPGHVLDCHEVSDSQLRIAGPFLRFLPAFQRVLKSQFVVHAILEDHFEVRQIARPRRLATVGILLADDLNDFLEADFIDRGQGVGVYRQTVSEHSTQGGARGRVEPSGEDPYPCANADAPRWRSG